MNAKQLIAKLTRAEVNGRYQPDTRRMMLQERIALTAAAKGGNRDKLASAMAEAVRVAKMWGVSL